MRRAAGNARLASGVGGEKSAACGVRRARCGGRNAVCRRWHSATASWGGLPAFPVYPASEPEYGRLAACPTDEGRVPLATALGRQCDCGLIFDLRTSQIHATIDADVGIVCNSSSSYEGRPWRAAGFLSRPQWPVPATCRPHWPVPAIGTHRPKGEGGLTAS